MEQYSAAEYTATPFTQKHLNLPKLVHFFFYDPFCIPHTVLVYIFASTLTDGGDFSGHSSVNREGARWLEGGFHADESNPPRCDAASARASVLKVCLSLCSWREVGGGGGGCTSRQATGLSRRV